MQPQNALSARPPIIAAAPGAEPATAEALGWQLRAALPPMRLHSVSIYDSQGNVLWLSEGALGPDEHSLVLEALETLTADSAKGCCENGLEDGRIAAFLAVRAPQGHLVGLAMILADFKSGGEGLSDRILSAPTRTIMQKLAVLLRPAGPRRADADPTALVLSLATEAPPAGPEAPAAAAAAPTQMPAPPKTDDEISARAVNDILEFELTDAPIPAPVREAAAGPPPPAPAQAPADTASARMLRPPAPADTGSARALGGTPSTGTGSQSTSDSACGSQRRTISLDPALITLEMLPFVKLRSGGRTRRFEVLPAGAARELRDPAVLDALAMQRLLAWLGSHRAAWTVEPASFTLNLSIATLEDEGFLKQVAAGLQSNGIAPDTVGFEIAEPLCTQRRAQVERFMAGCDKLGCFVVIDDFSFDSTVVPLLRSKALRLVKIDARLTGGALRDKLSQALVVAVVQAVKVLGIHCAAQQVDSQAVLQWLTAVGCDFAQGPMLARQQPLETLLGSDS
ncbi:MAG: EAL domain-containing protein [Proteobacteria bacterium]|nr:EAL domain-containing protein [Pseudomonadota bacterium]